MSSGPAVAPNGSFGPVRETTVGGVLREAAERAAGRPALVEGTADRRERRRWSYVAVVGVPDDHWGEQVAAFIKPAPGTPPPRKS